MESTARFPPVFQLFKLRLEPRQNVDKQRLLQDAHENIEMELPFIQNPDLRQYQTTRWLLIGLVITMVGMPVCFYFDLVIASNVNSRTLPGELRTLLNYAEVFAHAYGVIFILLAVWLASVTVRKKIQGLFVLLLANGVLILFLKSVIMRIRPRGGKAAEFDSVWETFAGLNPAVTSFDFSKLGISNLQSYPSGHTSTAFVLGIGLALLFPRARYLFLFFAGLASAQRVGFSAHYLSDVCGGVMVALLSVLLFISTSYGRKRLLGGSQDLGSE